MIFKKPADVRYTDMAIWIDHNAYQKDCDDSILYEYLFHLVNMLAHKGQYFLTSAEYEDFALSVASKLFLRLRSSKQAIYAQEQEKATLPQIKSILNYIKKIIYPAKMDYEKDRISNESQLNTEALNNYISNQLIRNSQLIENSISQIEFNEYLDKIVYIIKKHLFTSPYIADPYTWNNLYLSCILSFLNSITLCNASKERLSKRSDIIYNNTEYINKLYRQESADSIILYHIDKSMEGYIKVVLNEIRSQICAELLNIIDSSEYITELNKDLLFVTSMEDPE